MVQDSNESIWRNLKGPYPCLSLKTTIIAARG